MRVEGKGRQAGPWRLERGQDPVHEPAVVRRTGGRRRGCAFVQRGTKGQHPADLGREKTEKREERGLAARPLFRGRRVLLSPPGPERREAGSGEKLREQAKRPGKVALGDGLDEVRAVLLALVGDLPRGLLGRDAWSRRGVDEAVQIRQKRPRGEPAPAREKLE